VVWSPPGDEVAVINPFDDYVGIYDPVTGVEKAATSIAEAPTWTGRAVPGISAPTSESLNEGAATSPDGTMTATALLADGFNPELQIRNHADGTIVTAPAEAPFAWSPDSQLIAARTSWAVTLINPRDGTARMLAEGNVEEGSYSIGPMAWGPDGTTLAFTGWSEAPMD
jgi:hypothetical protein